MTMIKQQLKNTYIGFQNDELEATSNEFLPENTRGWEKETSSPSKVFNLVNLHSALLITFP